MPSVAHRGEAARRREGGRGAGPDDAAVREGAAVRRRQADRARAEGRPHPLRGTRSRAHRARGADAVGPRRARARVSREAATKLRSETALRCQMGSDTIFPTNRDRGGCPREKNGI